MFYVIDKSKILSYILAICTVVILFVAAAGLNGTDTNTAMTSTNIVENAVNQNVLNQNIAGQNVLNQSIAGQNVLNQSIVSQDTISYNQVETNSTN